MVYQICVCVSLAKWLGHWAYNQLPQVRLLMVEVALKIQCIKEFDYL